MLRKIWSKVKENRGASAVEYALLVGLIAAAGVGAITLLGGNISSTLNYVAGVVLKP